MIGKVTVIWTYTSKQEVYISLWAKAKITTRKINALKLIGSSNYKLWFYFQQKEMGTSIDYAKWEFRPIFDQLLMPFLFIPFKYDQFHRIKNYMRSVQEQHSPAFPKGLNCKFEHLKTVGEKYHIITYLIKLNYSRLKIFLPAHVAVFPGRIVLRPKCL